MLKDADRKFPASESHPWVCSECDSRWSALEFLEEHFIYDHELDEEQSENS